MPGVPRAPQRPALERPRTIEEFLALHQRPRIIAHRGFSGKAPENTLAAFRRAIDIRVDMIELDVTLSSDGTVVVFHDDTLERTSTGSGPVMERSLAELKELDAGRWFGAEFAGERIPTLAEALDLINGQALLNVEIKTEAVGDGTADGIVEKVVALVRERQMESQVIVSSFDPRALAQLRALVPELRSAALYNRELHEGMGPTAVMDHVGASAFNISRRLVTEEQVEECHRSGRPIAVYTVNEVEAMKLLFELGVNALFTDRPDLMIELLLGG